MTVSDLLMLATGIMVTTPPTLFAVAAWLTARGNKARLETVHRLVNSHMTDVQADLAVANARVASLLDLVATLQRKVEAAPPSLTQTETTTLSTTTTKPSEGAA